jgi:hypothetical protein
MINRVGKMCVAAMSLCMIVLIVTRKRGDGRYYLHFVSHHFPKYCHIIKKAIFKYWTSLNPHLGIFFSMDL